MTSLMGLPLELLVSISSYLPTSDLASLRLTCKQAERSLYEWFSQEFFTKKQFMLTHSSLQAFVDISKHASLSKKLRHVIIATNVFDEIPLRFRDEHAAARYIEGYESQKILLSTGIDREMLSEAFSNLVNLQTVGIRDFNAPRLRDGSGAQWSSWGSTTAYRETGIGLQFSRQGSFSNEVASRFVSRVFSSVLYALGKVGRRPSEIEVLLRREGLPDTAFALPEFLRPTVSPVLNYLTTLLLNVELGGRYYHTHHDGSITDASAGRSLRHFLASTPNLAHLRLNFSKHAIDQNEKFLEWLSDPVSSLSTPQSTFLEPAPVALTALKQLDLGQLNIRLQTIVALLYKFAPTLEDVSMWRMGLHAPMPPPPGHKPSYWADLFTTLSTIPNLKLKHLKVGILQQDHMHVNFTNQDTENGQPLKVVEHQGRDMDKFYGSLAERVIVSWPEPIDMSDGNSDEDEDMDDEEDGLDEDAEEQDDDDDEDDE
ncbi:hypothetical protein ACN47E_004068 [Coniothyrium glycines]